MVADVALELTPSPPPGPPLPPELATAALEEGPTVALAGLQRQAATCWADGPARFAAATPSIAAGLEGEGDATLLAGSACAGDSSWLPRLTL